MKAKYHAFYTGALVIALLSSLTRDASGNPPGQVPEPPSSEMIEKYNLLNPSRFSQSLGWATQLEITARNLRQEGTAQARTPDLTSSLTGRRSSSESIRNQGQANIAKADQQVQEARGIREGIESVKAFYQGLAGELESAPLQTLTGTNRKAMQGLVIGLYDGCVIVRRQGEAEFAGIGFKHLHPSSVEMVAARVREVMMIRMASALPTAGVIENGTGSGKIDMIAEMPDGILVRNATGATSLMKPMAGDKNLDGNILARWEKEVTETGSRIQKLEKLQESCAPELKAGLREVYARSGEPQAFVVQRILSFTDFPTLEKHGLYIYQVSIGGNPTILVTRQTQYLTAGTGQLLLQSAGNHDVLMLNGSRKTVPALVEVDQSVIERARELETGIQAAEAEVRGSLDAAKAELVKVEHNIGILKSNQVALAKVEEDLRAARSLAGK